MDTSETYVKMCEKAEEIQKLRDHLFEGADWITSKGGFYFFGPYEVPAILIRNLGEIWLPRQDQLQEMIRDKMSVPVMIYCLSLLLELRNISYLKTIDVNSMEQLLLALVMKERYDKVWNGEDWVGVSK